MPGTDDLDSLCFVSPRFLRRLDGSYAYEGPRPAPEEGVVWHRHDWSVRRPLVLRAGGLVRIVLRQRRWRLAGGGRTVMDRPPDLLPRRRVCLLLLSVLLLGLLTAPAGPCKVGVPPPGGRSVRQLRRDLAAACELAMHTQQAVRAAVLEFSEPRPAETMWKAAREPPDELARRCRHPSAPLLWRALRMLFDSAGQLDLHAAHLLVEARGRRPGPYARFLI